MNFADTVLKPLAQFFQVGVVHSLDMFVRCRRLAWQLPSARAYVGGFQLQLYGQFQASSPCHA